jgi:lipid II:glycine glycyltransferase (peptidoglycan interpeptide bridge formation enzyme)
MELSVTVRQAAVGRSIGHQLVRDQTDWDELVVEATDGNVLQSYHWGEFKAFTGWKPTRVAHYRGGTLIAGAQLLVKPTPIGSFAYAPRGPFVAEGHEGVVPEFLDELHRLARERGVFCLKIEPEWADDGSTIDRLRGLGFRPTAPVQPRSTILLDLRVDSRELAAGLSTRTRYNVGLAARRGIEVAPTDEAGLAAFYDLLRQTSERGHFPIRSGDYFRRLWRALAPSGQAHLFLAWHEGEPLSAALLLTMGRSAYYMYGGSASAQRNLKPSDLLQWEAIRWARDQGCISYDFWGIPDEVGRRPSTRLDDVEAPDIGSRNLWGVYHFKRGFGGRVVRYVGAHDYVYSPARYAIWRALYPRIRALRGALKPSSA